MRIKSSRRDKQNILLRYADLVCIFSKLSHMDREEVMLGIQNLRMELSPFKLKQRETSACQKTSTSEPLRPLQTLQTYSGEGQQLRQQSKCFDPKICDSCDTVITDFYVLKVMSSKPAGGVSERCWHERCLICCMCGKNMQNKCYENEGRLYCSADYFRLFGNRCAICHEHIRNMEMVMRPSTGVYCHVSCFRCVTCNRQLNTGDLYSINYEHSWPYCQLHTMERHNPYSQPQHNHSVMVGGDSMNGTMYWSDDCMDDINGKSDKRPRTVLSSSQRRVLKIAFDIDPKPSKKARHTMAMETGLTNRVVQVWFQNQRAKMKKRVKSSGTDDSSDSDPAAKKEETFHRSSSSSADENFGADVDDNEMDQDMTESMSDSTNTTFTQLEVPKHGDGVLFAKNTDSGSIAQFNTTLTSFY